MNLRGMRGRVTGIVIGVAALGLLAEPAAARVRVVATLPDLGHVARLVGADQVAVEVLCPGDRDPHFLPAKPSLSRTLAKADLLLYNGLELEIGWLPQLIGKARNPEIRPGRPGELDCSTAVADLLEVPGAGVDRSEGDVHPLGNPHYTLDPRRMAAVAAVLAERLGQLDPDHAADYRARSRAFAAEVDVRIPAWRATAGRATRVPVVIYHRNWAYLVDWLGLQVVGEIEHRPGIAPSPRHVQTLIDQGRHLPELLVVATTWDHHHVAQEVADRSGAELVTLPAQSGAADGADDYFALIDTICRELGAAGARLAARGEERP